MEVGTVNGLMRTPYAVTMEAERAHPRPHVLAASTLGVGVMLLGAFLPWLRSGTRQRSSFELFAVIERLELSPDGPGGFVVRSWPVMPAVLLVGVALLWWRLPRVGAVVLTVGVAHALAMVVAMTVAPVAAGVGALVTLVGSLLVIPALVTVAWPARG